LAMLTGPQPEVHSLLSAVWLTSP